LKSSGARGLLPLSYRENRADTVLSELWTIQVVFFEKSIIQPPWPKRKPLLRRLFRGKRKGTGWLSLNPIRTFQFNKKSDQ